MTTLKNRIANDATEALKQQKTEKLKVLRYVLGVIQTAEKKGKTSVEFTDEQVASTLSNIAKQNRDNITLYAKAGESQKVAEAEQELAILEEYLPKQLTEDEVRVIVAAAVAEAGDAANMGSIMKAVIPQTRNKADGALVKAVVLELLK